MDGPEAVGLEGLPSVGSRPGTGTVRLLPRMPFSRDAEGVVDGQSGAGVVSCVCPVKCSMVCEGTLDN